MKPVLVAALFALVACKASSGAAPLAPSGETSTPTKPSTPSEGGGCAASGKQWFTPGCGGGPVIEPGCYTRCDSDACAAGEVCTTVTTNPCGETEDGQVLACDACGAETKLCLPASG